MFPGIGPRFKDIINFAWVCMRACFWRMWKRADVVLSGHACLGLMDPCWFVEEGCVGRNTHCRGEWGKETVHKMYHLTKYLWRGHHFMESMKEETTWKSGKSGSSYPYRLERDALQTACGINQHSLSLHLVLISLHTVFQHKQMENKSHHYAKKRCFGGGYLHCTPKKHLVFFVLLLPLPTFIWLTYSAGVIVSFD